MQVGVCVCVEVVFCVFFLSVGECKAEIHRVEAKALCLLKAALPSTTVYLSHVQKVLPQKVTVLHPYLRFPWRFLHRQVGNNGWNPQKPCSLPPLTFHRIFWVLLHNTLTSLVCFGVCDHGFLCYSNHSERPETALFLVGGYGFVEYTVCKCSAEG